MIDVFGGFAGGGSIGSRGSPVVEVPPGKHGKPGENSVFHSQNFQHIKVKWDIDYEPKLWIEGNDVQEKPTFKLLNKYDHKYDASPNKLEKTPYERN